MRRRLSSEPPRRLGLQWTARADVPAHLLTAARGMTGRLALRKIARWASACSAPFASQSAFWIAVFVVVFLLFSGALEQD
jgi:hypothetical protein